MLKSAQITSVGMMAIAALMVTGCSGQDSAQDQPNAAMTNAGNVTAPADASDSLAFEWGANGFEQLDAAYQWMGSARRDESFEPNFSLSVPETDDVIWSSGCSADGRIKTQVHVAPPKDMKGNRADFQFETDASGKTFTYPARYLSSGQFDGFEIVQSASDPMFAAMKTGSWAYLQVGEGSSATKLRVSLAKAASALNIFLPACSAPKAASPAAPTPTETYACDDGRTAKASYMGNDTETPVVRLMVDGNALLLPQTLSGSGVRYETEIAGKRYYWLTKAKEGVFIVSDANDMDGSTEITTRCVAR